MRKIIFTLLFSVYAIILGVKANAQGTLIHYWHFNNFTTAMYTPSIVGIPADFSIHDTSKAKILYAELPGVSSSYSTYIDPNPAISTDYDTVNARMGQPPGNMMRPRNPADSMRLLFYIPTVHYKNILLKYATQSSSVAHGDTYQVFDYSVDSGVTWTTSGLSELQDSAWLVMKLVSVSITDPLANDNPKLVFRIRFSGNTLLTSGNNRFDNVTLEGDSIIIPPAITTTPTTFGPYCNTTTGIISVPFTTTGAFTGAFSVQLSNSSGSFASGTTIIGSGTTSPITASIPGGTTPGAYRLRVINTITSPSVYGTDNGSDITVNGPPVAYAVTGGGTGCAGAGVPVGLANSQVGASYQLYMSGSPVGAPVIGTGSAISFGNQTVAGTYYARAVYTATAACNNTMTGTASVTLSPGPAIITGASTVCVGQTIALHDATSAGTWSSSATSLATVTSTGVVTGVTAGTATISFTAIGCYSIAVVTINPLASITGVTNMCVGASTTLSDAITGGAWSSSSTNVSVNSASGMVTGVNSGSTAAVVYTTPGGCQAITTVTVNVSPSAISGATAVCASATTNLTNIATGGTWTSSNTGVATISSGGVVSGITIGTTTISYVLTDGCNAALPFSVSLSPSAIASPATICAGTTVSLTDAVSGGVWTSSSSASIATIGSLSGQISAVAPGTSTITYSLGTSCTVTKIVTINVSPSAIAGTTSICAGATAALTDPTSGGVWSSSSSAVSVSGTGIITGAGVGTSTITYTLAGCAAITTVTVNMAPVTISGASALCAGSTTLLSDAAMGGSWSSAGTAISINSGGLVSGLSAGTATVTYAIGSCSITKLITVNPVATMTGPTGVCIGSTATLMPSVTGGTWVSAPTSIATISGSGVVYGVTAGVTNITYVLSTGCTTYTAVTVNTIPTAITGTLHTCVGATTTLGDGAGGGIWSVTPTSRATVGVASAVVTGVSAGTAAVTYSLGTGCTVTAVVTINPLPSPISGTTQVCLGLTTPLTDGTSGGVWNSATPTTATVSAGGVVGGIVPGNDTITYTIPTGCMSVAVVTVNPLPMPITVTGYVCLGLNTSLTDPSMGGTWSSSNTAQAVIDMSTGVVTGVSAGMPTITYTLPTTCIITTTVTVNAIAPPITGTLHVCEALSTTLRDTLPGGAWSSSDNSIATVTSGGTVTGVSAGVITISYISAICPATTTVTINAIPGPIGGTSEFCAGTYVTLADAGSGTWSSSNIYVASVDPTTGSVRGQAAGVATITYTLDVGCVNTTHVTIDPLPATIMGSAYTCLGGSLSLTEATTGGTWSSINTGIATVDGSGHVTSVADGVAIISYTIPSGCAAAKAISVITVPGILGGGNVCAFGGSSLSLTDAVTGGTWTSSLVYISDSGTVTTALPGVASVTYTIAAGCTNTITFTVNPLPGPVTGNTNLCVGLTTTLSDTSTGTWSSGNPAIATVNTTTGLVSGMSAGTAVISFTNASGCMATYTVNVHALPSVIAGVVTLCSGTTGSLIDATSGGAWSSSAPGVATISGSGVVSGVSAGSATITYDLGASCIATTIITVNPSPTVYRVTGGGAYCVGGTGLDIGLAASYAGINYQLYYGTMPVGDSIRGTYSDIHFGLQTAAGTYSVIATNATTLCTSSLGGTTITVAPLPAVHTVTGGGTYCTGTAGAHIGLNASDVGVAYQLYNGSATAGASLTGTGAALDFGAHTAGLYDVVATSLVAGCATHMSDSVAIIVAPLVTPSVTVTSSLGDVLCAGTATTFSTAITNGGAAPIYEWAVNGAIVSATGSTYTYTPANGDVVKAILVSNAACASPDTVSSAVTITVRPVVVPTVTIAATPGTTITPGASVTLTATATNAGPSPVYQWKLNGIVVTAVTTNTYTSSTFANGDIITCTVTSSGSCPGQTAASQVTIIVNSHVGIQQLSSADNIRVIPNPSKGEFMISGTFGSSTSEKVSVEISNMLGQVIYRDEVLTQNGEISTHVVINTNLISNGMYLLTLHSGSAYQVFHIVIAQ